jgi:hypothetical protein
MVPFIYVGPGETPKELPVLGCVLAVGVSVPEAVPFVNKVLAAPDAYKEPYRNRVLVGIAIVPAISLLYHDVDRDVPPLLYTIVSS